MHDARNAKFLKRIGEMGYCCPDRFFKVYEKTPTAILARIAFVSERTIRFWKRRKSRCGYC